MAKFKIRLDGHYDAQRVAVETTIAGARDPVTGKALVLEPGDWLVTTPTGEVKCVRDRTFRQVYEPADDEARRMCASLPQEG